MAWQFAQQFTWKGAHEGHTHSTHSREPQSAVIVCTHFRVKINVYSEKAPGRSDAFTRTDLVGKKTSSTDCRLQQLPRPFFWWNEKYLQKIRTGWWSVVSASWVVGYNNLSTFEVILYAFYYVFLFILSYTKENILGSLWYLLQFCIWLLTNNSLFIIMTNLYFGIQRKSKTNRETLFSDDLLILMFICAVFLLFAWIASIFVCLVFLL